METKDTVLFGPGYPPYPVVYEAINTILTHLEIKGTFKQDKIETLAMEIPELKKFLDPLFQEMENNLRAYYKYRTGKDLD